MKRAKRILCMGILLTFAMAVFSLSIHLETRSVSAGQSVYLPVLMYHSILDSTAKAGKYTIPPGVLAQDLQYLSEQGYTAVLPRQVIDFANGKGSLPSKPVMITFDDGYYNNYSYVYPLLEQYDMRALISVVGNFTQQYSEPGAEMNNNYSHLSWAQLNEMTASGRIEVGNHSYDMHRQQTRNGFCRVSNEDDWEYIYCVTEDIAKMQRLCRENLQDEVKVLTYPYGTYDDLTEQIAADQGFAMTLTCYEKVNVVTYGQPEALFGMGRYNRPYGISTEEFMQTVLP